MFSLLLIEETQLLLSKIADVILAIESELRRLELWSDERPSKEALSSPQPFCYDTLSFPQWVQWIFIPRMKQVIEEGGALPEKSLIQPMAEEMLKDLDNDFSHFLTLLSQFDELINQGANESK